MSVTEESTERRSPARAPESFEQRAARLSAAEQAVAALDSEARQAATELVDAVEAHHAAVLRRVVGRLRQDERGAELLYEVVEDPEVYASLVKAGIVRPSLAMQAIQVLDGIRPYLQSHNGDVELVRIEGGTAYVRLLGSCQGCGSSSTTLRDSVAEALLAHLPEISDVEEVPPEVAPSDTFVPVSALSVRRSGGPGPTSP
jgi:Fe-S cluster biogenesis protein NfuA